MMLHTSSRPGPIIGLTSHELMLHACDSFSKPWHLCVTKCTCNNRHLQYTFVCYYRRPSKAGTINTPSVGGVCFVSTLNSLHFLLHAIPRPFAPPSRRTTTNRSSSFSHMSGTRHTRSARVASNAKVNEEEEGTEDGMSVPQETVEKLQSYAFRPTGKRKGYKSEGISEGRCNCSNTSRRRFFRFGSASITRNSRAFQAMRQNKIIANRSYRRVKTFKET